MVNDYLHVKYMGWAYSLMTWHPRKISYNYQNVPGMHVSVYYYGPTESIDSHVAYSIWFHLYLKVISVVYSVPVN